MTKWSLKGALTLWILSPLCTLTLFVLIWGKWERVRRDRLTNPAYRLTSLIQTGPERDALKGEYLAELLGLSVDQPVSIYSIDLEKAQKTLCASPLIQEAKIERRPPHSLYIDYTVRRPIARLADYANTLIDKTGHIFPMTPFFSPKELPELYLGLPPFGEKEDGFGRKGGRWQSPVEGRFLSLALEVLAFLDAPTWQEVLSEEKGKVLTRWSVKRIDVSNAFAKSLGQREIVLLTEDHLVFLKEGGEMRAVFPKILRLNPKTYAQQLSHFFTLRSSMLEDYKKQMIKGALSGTFAPRIVDLRIGSLALVQND